MKLLEKCQGLRLGHKTPAAFELVVAFSADDYIFTMWDASRWVICDKVGGCVFSRYTEKTNTKYVVNDFKNANNVEVLDVWETNFCRLDRFTDVNDR